MQPSFLPALKLVADEHGVAVASKIDPALPSAALRVEAAQISVLETAMKLAKKCKRSKRLCARDVERAIALEFNETPLYFVSDTQKSLDFVSKTNQASASAAAAATAAVVPAPTLLQTFYDVDLNLQSYVAAAPEMIPRVPLAPTYTVHWLAVEGVQPAIPENQPVEDFAEMPTNSSFNSSSNKKKDLEEGTAVMTHELQLYYDEAIKSLLEAEANGGEGKASRIVLASLANDAGIDRLVPHFVAFISQRINEKQAASTALQSDVATTSSALQALWTSLRLANALIANEHLRNLELYLHQLLPSLLSCVVAKKLCPGSVSAAPQQEEDHWALRDYAAQVVAALCRKFGETYAGLQARVCKVYTDALEGHGTASSPLTTRYGGVVGLNALGPLVVDSLLVPYLTCTPDLIAQLQEQLESVGEYDAESEAALVTRIEAFKLYHALRQALILSVQREEAEGGGKPVGQVFGSAKRELLRELGYETTTSLGMGEAW